ncbi:MAG: DUF1837 domain-containing protein [Planctomycetes bacterium]|nr:DUF1837 domain-containing protein [Planctomycetota bacterium]
MTFEAHTTPLNELKRLLAANRANYDACLDHIDHQDSCGGVVARTRLHHLKFDPNGQPKLHALARCLAEHVIEYATSARTRPTPQSSQEWTALVNETRRMFRVNTQERGLRDLSGEAGEMLLYFLLEAVIGAPQVIAKLELKTNPALESNGSDGIHMRWDESDGVVDVYFGEAKLHKSLSSAISDGFDSIEKFYSNGMREHEYALVTRHFKGVDTSLRLAVADILNTGKPGPDARVNHACLFGYDWSAIAATPGTAVEVLVSEYRRQYLEQSPKLHARLQKHFESCSWKQVRFEVFFIPFESVQAFRDAFAKAMS